MASPEGEENMVVIYHEIDTSRLRHNGRNCPDNILKLIFLNENVWIAIKISLRFVPRSQIIWNNDG